MSLTEPLILAARESYAHDRCTLEEFEDLVERVLRCRFPLPLELVARTVISVCDADGRLIFDDSYLWHEAQRAKRFAELKADRRPTVEGWPDVPRVTPWGPPPPPPDHAPEFAR